MIQRIQTLYLLGIIILSTFTVFSTFADFVANANGVIHTLTLIGVFEKSGLNSNLISSTWALSTFGLIIPIFAGICIFRYKNRQSQIRLAKINYLFLVLFYIALGVYIYVYAHSLGANVNIRFEVVLPLICIILNFLAINGIKKDEALVQSLNRLR